MTSTMTVNGAIHVRITSGDPAQVTVHGALDDFARMLIAECGFVPTGQARTEYTLPATANGRDAAGRAVRLLNSFDRHVVIDFALPGQH